MRSMRIIKRNMDSFLSQTIHAARLKALYWAVGVLIQGKRLSLTALGRFAQGPAYTKHYIKRVDRLLGNKRLHKEAHTIFAGLAVFLIQKIRRPIVCVDWTPIGEAHYALVASMPVNGRALPIYEEVYAEKENNTQKAHKRFLKNLKAVVPSTCCPIIVTDAGFKNPWFKTVQKQGWDFVGRTGSNTKASDCNGDDWIETKSIMKRAEEKALNLGTWLLAKSCPLQVNLVLGKAVAKKKKKKTTGKKKRKPASAAQKKSRNRALEPWLLATSLPVETANSIVKLYAKRMQIEEGFRDVKNHRFGWCFEDANSRSPERLRVLLLIGAIAMLAVTLIGQAAEQRNMQRRYQANTIRKRRVLSLFVLGMNLIQRWEDNIFDDDELIKSLDFIKNHFGWRENA